MKVCVEKHGMGLKQDQISRITVLSESRMVSEYNILKQETAELHGDITSELLIQRYDLFNDCSFNKSLAKLFGLISNVVSSGISTQDFCFRLLSFTSSMKLSWQQLDSIAT